MDSTTQASSRGMEPDRSFGRYLIDSFKTQASGSKDIPFEEIDLSLYKTSSKRLGFKTNEERLHLWIQTIITRYFDHLNTLDEYNFSW